MSPRASSVFQVSTIGALLEGLYDIDFSYGELKRRGDFGLGTFEALDGEMVAVDGAFYQVRADGSVHPVPDSAKTPFAVVTFFTPDTTFRLAGTLNMESLTARLDRDHVDANLPYAIRLDGRFTRMTTRSVPRQQKPYSRFVTVTAKQATFDLTNVQGTLVGFRFPAYMSELNVPGYHFHFISSDRTSGGHVLAFELGSGVVSLSEIPGFQLRLPQDTAFRRLQLGSVSAGEIEAAEH